MKKRLGVLHLLAGLVVGFAFTLIGMLLLLLGLTFLPVLGVLIGLPVLRMSWFFLCPKVPVDTADVRILRLASAAEGAYMGRQARA
jgi:hypothetical protein